MADREAGVRPSGRQVGYVVIGAGHIAQTAVLPAFAHAQRNSRLVAIVSGDPLKRRALGDRYRVPTFDYDALDDCLARPEVDAAYIALPNSEHAAVVEQCARAGVHVLCEKPMALTEADCLRMIRACESNRVKLMVAYRLHFDPANLRAIELGATGPLGDPRIFSSTFSFQLEEENIRARSALGGGPLFDIGIYCINAARYLFRAEPIEVFAFAATPRADPRFVEVDASVAAALKFPEDKVASFSCSFVAASCASYRLVGDRGELWLENAYHYATERALRVRIGDEGHEEHFPATDQFGPELLYFSDCVIEDRAIEPDGWEGLADVRIISALHQSILSGQPVHLPRFERTLRPDRSLELAEPPVESPQPIHAEAPAHG